MNSKLYNMVRGFIILFFGAAILLFFQNCQNYSGQISSASLDKNKISPTQDPSISTPDSQIPVSTDPGTGSNPSGGITDNNDPVNNTGNPIIRIDDHVTPCTPGVTCPDGVKICDPNSLGLNNLKENKILNLTMETNNNFDLTIPNGIKLVRYQGAEPLHIKNVAHQSDTQICGNIIIDQLQASGGFIITNVQIAKLNISGNITSQKFDGDFLVPVGSKVSGNKKCQVNENYEIVNCEDLP